MTVKIAVIGGGSSMFVPGVVRKLLQVPCFEGAELRLMDIDEKRLSVMEKLATDLAEAEHRKLFVGATTERPEAFRGVDFAVVAISVGGMPAWATASRCRRSMVCSCISPTRLAPAAFSAPCATRR